MGIIKEFLNSPAAEMKVMRSVEYQYNGDLLFKDSKQPFPT